MSKNDPFKGLMEAIASGNVDVTVEGGPHNEDTKLSDEAQVAILMESYAAFLNPEDFKLGDLVRYRKEVSYVRNPRRPHIVMGFIDPPKELPLNETTEGSCTAYRKYDILIGCVKADGSVLKYHADRRELEYYPDSAKLKGHS